MENRHQSQAIRSHLDEKEREEETGEHEGSEIHEEEEGHDDHEGSLEHSKHAHPEHEGEVHEFCSHCGSKLDEMPVENSVRL